MKWQTRTRSICTSLCFGMNSTFTMPCTFDKQQQEPPRNVRWKTKKLFGFAFVPELCSLVFAYWTERHNTRHRKTNFRLSHIHKQRAADAFACPVAVFFFYISTVARHIDWVDYMTLECEIHHECQCCGTYIHTLFDSNCMTTTSARLSIVNRTKRSISVMFLLLLLSLQFSQQQKKASVSGRENLIERRFNRIESRLKFHSASVRARIRFGRFHTI